jgi:hypothetical protein
MYPYSILRVSNNKYLEQVIIARKWHSKDLSPGLIPCLSTTLLFTDKPCSGNEEKNMAEYL